jgi:hypothetical protein
VTSYTEAGGLPPANHVAQAMRHGLAMPRDDVIGEHFPERVGKFSEAKRRARRDREPQEQQIAPPRGSTSNTQDALINALQGSAAGNHKP